jgi:hypothetical protein
MALKPPICSYGPDFPGANKQIEEISVTKRKYRHRRSVDVRINWLQPHVDGFKEWLSQQNYSPATIVEVVRLLALWGDWVRAAGFGVETLAAGLNASASVFKGSKTARAPHGAAALFVAYLSEAVALRLDDILPDGVLRIRETKFRKSRLVPLHPTVVEALKRYLGARCQLASDSDWLFLSTEHRQMCLRIVNYTFRCVTRRAGILSERSQQPRIHDLRHTFATRVLEQCGAGRSEVARHFVALSTYLGHVSIHNTYWYLQATPEMMADIAAAAETLFREDDA